MIKTAQSIIPVVIASTSLTVPTPAADRSGANPLAELTPPPGARAGALQISNQGTAPSAGLHRPDITKVSAPQHENAEVKLESFLKSDPLTVEAALEQEALTLKNYVYIKTFLENYSSVRRFDPNSIDFGAMRDYAMAEGILYDKLDAKVAEAGRTELASQFGEQTDSSSDKLIKGVIDIVEDLSGPGYGTAIKGGDVLIEAYEASDKRRVDRMLNTPIDVGTPQKRREMAAKLHQVIKDPEIYHMFTNRYPGKAVHPELTRDQIAEKFPALAEKAKFRDMAMVVVQNSKDIQKMKARLSDLNERTSKNTAGLKQLREDLKALEERQDEKLKGLGQYLSKQIETMFQEIAKPTKAQIRQYNIQNTAAWCNAVTDLMQLIDPKAAQVFGALSNIGVNLALAVSTQSPMAYASLVSAICKSILTLGHHGPSFEEQMGKAISQLQESVNLLHLRFDRLEMILQGNSAQLKQIIESLQKVTRDMLLLHLSQERIERRMEDNIDRVSSTFEETRRNGIDSLRSEFKNALNRADILTRGITNKEAQIDILLEGPKLLEGMVRHAITESGSSALTGANASRAESLDLRLAAELGLRGPQQSPALIRRALNELCGLDHNVIPSKIRNPDEFAIAAATAEYFSKRWRHLGVELTWVQKQQLKEGTEEIRRFAEAITSPEAIAASLEFYNSTYEEVISHIRKAAEDSRVTSLVGIPDGWNILNGMEQFQPLSEGELAERLAADSQTAPISTSPGDTIKKELRKVQHKYVRIQGNPPLNNGILPLEFTPELVRVTSIGNLAYEFSKLAQLPLPPDSAGKYDRFALKTTWDFKPNLKLDWSLIKRGWGWMVSFSSLPEYLFTISTGPKGSIPLSKLTLGSVNRVRVTTPSIFLRRSIPTPPCSYDPALYQTITNPWANHADENQGLLASELVGTERQGSAPGLPLVANLNLSEPATATTAPAPDERAQKRYNQLMNDYETTYQSIRDGFIKHIVHDGIRPGTPLYESLQRLEGARMLALSQFQLGADNFLASRPELVDVFVGGVGRRWLVNILADAVQSSEPFGVYLDNLQCRVDNTIVKITDATKELEATRKAKQSGEPAR